MKKFFKWSSIIIGSLLLIVLVVAAVMVLRFNSRLETKYNIEALPMLIPDDSSSAAEGERLASIHCSTCHGADMAGTSMFNDPKLGFINAPNLTSGKGGIGSTYRDIDWVLAIRHGVRKDGLPLMVMPSKDFNHFSEDQLGKIICYLKNVKPVDKEWKKYEFTYMAKILATMGAFGELVGAEVIDHKAPFEKAPDTAAGPQLGEYMIKIGGCRSCHGDNLAGGKDPNPDAPPSPNLTPGGNFGKWTEADFIKTLRTGTTPEGKQLSQFMPWKAMAGMTDVEMRSIYFYLKTQPTLPTNP